MATKVYETVELELLDGRSITVKPLNLKNLREVMKEWQKAAEVQNEDEFLDILINCTAIAFKQFAPDLSEKSNIEEAVDLQTMYKILEIAADIRLNDPNLVATAQELAGRI
jgi:shikimate 5-dehydrogenase